MKPPAAVSMTPTTEAVSQAGLGNDGVRLLSILVLTG